MNVQLLTWVTGSYKTERATVGQQQAPWTQVPVPCVDHAVKHGLKQQEVAHPLRHYHIHLLHWQLRVLKPPLHQTYLL